MFCTFKSCSLQTKHFCSPTVMLVRDHAATKRVLWETFQLKSHYWSLRLLNPENRANSPLLKKA